MPLSKQALLRFPDQRRECESSRNDAVKERLIAADNSRSCECSREQPLSNASERHPTVHYALFIAAGTELFRKLLAKHEQYSSLMLFFRNVRRVCFLFPLRF